MTANLSPHLIDMMRLDAERAARRAARAADLADRPRRRFAFGWRRRRGGGARHRVAPA